MNYQSRPGSIMLNGYARGTPLQSSIEGRFPPHNRLQYRFDSVQQDESLLGENALVTAIGENHHTAPPLDWVQGSLNANPRADTPYPYRDTIASFGGVEYHRPVGSATTTTVATRHRRNRPVYFCEVPGCTSKGFTQKHNFECTLEEFTRGERS
ncbi:hypothetical protein PM082_024191 [Marasmius tenuissimus]|nr:hypothetical protein PM082_024191 [Marasmius tenuissimus]